jgi:MerR family transcriptional regulator, light-induced transcriptional regulator
MDKIVDMSIATVERETGIGKDTLRVWERRYGFPQPLRDSKGERLYPSRQVDQLRLIKRLMDQGHRPGRLLSVSEEERLELAAAKPAIHPARSKDEQDLIQQTLDLLKSHDTQGLRLAFNQAMMRQGLHQFVLGTVVALNRSVGEAWRRGELEIFEEHLYSEQLKSLLRQAINSLPADANGHPRILLTTFPEEQHALGLLMAECLFTLEGATCISLGTQTPLFDIRLAALAHRADIVALSFSTAFSVRQRAPLLNQLREMLPSTVELWAGGMASEKLPAIDGVVLLPTLEAGLAALKNFRQKVGD